MKTKYVKVPVSERLPEKETTVIVIDKSGNPYEGFVTEKGIWQVYTPYDYGDIEYWLEEKEDHSEEMLSMLEEVKDFFQPHFFSEPLEGQEEFINQIEQLINKVKDNGNSKETDKKAT